MPPTAREIRTRPTRVPENPCPHPHPGGRFRTLQWMPHTFDGYSTSWSPDEHESSLKKTEVRVAQSTRTNLSGAYDTQLLSSTVPLNSMYGLVTVMYVFPPTNWSGLGGTRSIWNPFVHGSTSWAAASAPVNSSVNTIAPVQSSCSYFLKYLGGTFDLAVAE
ncbi:hypothetical protein H310_02379 [Aphanomyces invadans]|uniref:Uncharacterized protein n=1 Tax=Aphanomyces invadans TaxID=157072 RepID=A0A024UQW4_9STRA|nr:hypothetical protein H310_02379 [Aphanomyces invadans]ETW07998.1 hypothetical protein H310_02379 [Aphanomyces invadans]|eukprot:XP_008864091.1 hypothetical protein H310_02379 [Aphanomyces invadans]